MKSTVSDSKIKLLVIALDGATFDLIKPWADEGYLPTMAKLINQGVWGNLQSTYPPLTGPAWSSFMTGKSPAKHGVLEFFKKKEGSYNQQLNTRFDIDGTSIWTYLSDAGKHVGVIGVPLTYPPEPVNGSLITGLLTPYGCKDFTHPIDLLDELESEVGQVRIRHDEKYHRSNPQPFIQEQYEILDNNKQIALYLMEHKPWDFFMLHLLGTDRIQHEFWHTLDKNHPNNSPTENEQLGNVVLDYFIKLDETLNELIQASRQANIMLMSDHGFGPIYRFFNVNTWLLKLGYLKLKRSPSCQFRYLLFKTGFNYSVLANWILKLGLGKKAVRLGRAKREDLQRKLFLSLSDVDWSRSKLYSMGNFGQIYVNLVGREPQGIVMPGNQYDHLINEVCELLKSLKDPATNELVVDQIYDRNQIYQGAYKKQAPDIIYLTRGMEYKAMGLSDFASPNVFDPVYGTTGHHRMNGILLCNGKGVFKEGQTINNAHIQDLAPTILYMMNLNIPEDMDGKVLLDLFTTKFNTDHKIDYKHSNGMKQESIGSLLTEEEHAELIERMQDLGYVT